MASAAQFSHGNGPRKSILDLAPLELDCMNMLWALGEGTVRDVQGRLARVRPRAYTTIMTILDRLAQKGVVTRAKAGRAYLYRPNLTAEEARSNAIEQVVEGFFEGSAEAMAEHLTGARTAPQRVAAARAARRQTPRPGHRRAASDVQKAPQPVVPTRLDESLL